MEKIIWKCSRNTFDRMNRDNMGVCLACGGTAYDCEPDARQYECEGCGKKKVYGIEEALVMERIEILDNKELAAVDPSHVIND